MSLKLIIMNWFTSLFKNKKSSMPDDRYVMRLSVCHETYSIEEFDLQFKRNTDRDGLPEGEAYGGFITCTLIGMPGDELLRWAAYSHSREDGEIRIYQKDQPDQQAAFALRFVEGNCIRLQRKVDRISNSSSIVLLFAARTLKFIDEEFENEWH